VPALLKLDFGPFSSSWRIPAGDRLVTPGSAHLQATQIENIENKHFEVEDDPLCEFSSVVFVVFWISEFHYRAILNFICRFWGSGASFQTEDARHEYLPPAAFGARQTHLPDT
jgi:hypothetical protein